VVADGPRQVLAKLLAQRRQFLDFLLDVIQVLGQRGAGAHAEKGRGAQNADQHFQNLANRVQDVAGGAKTL